MWMQMIWGRLLMRNRALWLGLFALLSGCGDTATGDDDDDAVDSVPELDCDVELSPSADDQTAAMHSTLCVEGV